ncbi:hypothetical protein [Burkholderia singularis]|uniref:hypothetical protein n=1 Tax=Burkholderia singularis TaxID=1503053 RepID=UPI00117C5080|nr:hypothetical protein [Burkholderia singularis]
MKRMAWAHPVTFEPIIRFRLSDPLSRAVVDYRGWAGSVFFRKTRIPRFHSRNQILAETTIGGIEWRDDGTVEAVSLPSVKSERGENR